MLKTIAIDFDGVIHTYSRGWLDGRIYDRPMDNALRSIKDLMDEGYAVYIHSTRSPRQIKEYLDEHLSIKHMNAPAGVDPKELFFGYDCKVIPRYRRKGLRFERVKFWDTPGVLGITDRKLPAVMYIDDRAFKFKTTWTRALPEIRKELKKHA